MKSPVEMCYLNPPRKSKMKNPLVVGYKGEIGSFILNQLLKIMPKASDIWCIDINNTEEEVLERIAKSDTIFLCVPIEETLNWICKYKDHLIGKTVVEQTSLKTLCFSDAILKNFKDQGIRLLSMHILFRPSATTNSNERNIAIIKFTDWDVALTSFISYMSGGLNIFYSDMHEHDKEMAYQQALLHRVLLALNATVKYKCTALAQNVKALAERIQLGNTKLYETLQQNPKLDEAISEFNNKMKGFEI